MAYGDPFDDDGLAVEDVPMCPVCPRSADKPPRSTAVASPPGYCCHYCGWWFPPTGGRVDAKRRGLWDEATRDGVAS